MSSQGLVSGLASTLSGLLREVSVRWEGATLSNVNVLKKSGKPAVRC